MTKKINKKIFYYLLPFLIGIFSSFSLPPYNFIFINFITFPILLFILIEAQKKIKTKFYNFLIGWIFGIGYFSSNIYWIVYSLTFDEIFSSIIPFALVILPSFLGLFYGLATLIISEFKLKINISTILIFSLVFGIIEFFRGNIIGGFPWNLIVYSLSDYVNSLQILSVIGTYSLNLILITFFLLPLFFVLEKNFKFKLYIIIILLLVIVSNNFYGSLKIEQNQAFHKNFNDFKIKIISPKIAIEKFFEENNEGFIINELIELSNPNIEQKTIFIFPEGALVGINLEYLKNYKELFKRNFSDKHKIILGINTEVLENDLIKTYNSMVLLDNNLNLLQKYNKNKLVPFGEFLPFEKFFKKIGLKKITYGYESFSPGNKRELFFLNNLAFIPLICYEIIYSGSLSSSKNANFIINISEDGWFGNSVGPHQHFSHSVFRAIEEGKNVIRSANNGISAYIDPNGIVLSKLESTERGVLEINDYKNLEKTIFSKFGNKIFFYFIIIYISLIFFIKIFINKREKR